MLLNVTVFERTTPKKKPETVGCKEKGQILDPISVNATFIKKWKLFSKSKNVENTESGNLYKQLN